MSHLSDRERQALRLASELRKRMEDWLGSRGIPAPLVISPFVDPAGHANVLVRMNSQVALAMILGFEEQHRRLPEEADRATRPCAPDDVQVWPSGEGHR
ncbi:hypothetical protein AB0M95_36385 [Sphaerisporangium sp. NPDC051017]|uniref:hypothetical protein n=1 Tax=Sphaerisporangium sp. NPDC051017 TaxID=3154636 RepID=UPI00342524CE